MASNVHCLHCGNDSWVFDAFSDIILSIRPLKRRSNNRSSGTRYNFLSKLNPFKSRYSSTLKEESEEEEDAQDEALDGETLMKQRMEQESQVSSASYLSFPVSDIEEGQVPGFEEDKNGVLYIPKKYGMEANPNET